MPPSAILLGRRLRDIERRLAVAYATCVTAQRALLAQNCEQDREIALCLRWGVCEIISSQQEHLLGLASDLPTGREPGTQTVESNSDSGDTAAAESP